MKTALEIREKFVQGKISAAEIVKSYLERIKQHDSELNAFLAVFDKRAMERAKALDAKRERGESLGRLAGIPIAIKDNILIEDELCTCASKMLENYKAPYSATVVRLLEQEDAILIGKTNMDEFAMGGSGIHSAFGPTKNPYDLTCSPGGSSSGSAAAVSANFCPIALGSDTGGSIRQPAAWSGIVGFKPSYGRVSRYGLVAFGSSLDQIGPLAHTVKDAALIMEVLAQHCEHDATSLNTSPIRYLDELESSLEGKRIGVPWHFLEELNGELKDNFEESIEKLKSRGAQIINVDLDILQYGVAIYYILSTAEASTNLARFDGIRYGYRDKEAKTLEEIYRLSRSKGFGWEVKNRILLGTSVLSSCSYEELFAKAQKVRTLLIKKMREAFGKCDCIALPTAPSTAFPLDGIKDPLQEYLQDLYTIGANMAGLPGISIPSGMSAKGKPFAIQFMGPQTHDLEVLRIAYAFESATTPIPPPEFGDVS
ncbi:MAG: Asp-tRNA(Asn)/Glu-tRNA(Gln) amidotransferase subunit GatA [Simkaniaceae bacterium]|nr:Asp-tRNA(Asn)/Glu-tRNA(Gln) amidotransferase subunit GatA [Candidatus Sacchlamyda saccharinae]